MKKILYLMLMLVYLSGCALSTIKAPRKSSSRTVSEPVVERESFVSKIMPRSSAIEEKEEPLSKEETLPKRNIIPSGKEEIK